MSSCWSGFVRSFRSFTFVTVVTIIQALLTLNVSRWFGETPTLIVEGVRDLVPALREKAFFGLNIRIFEDPAAKQTKIFP